MGKFAIIDIGSNTVRLVVYENRERAPYVVFNEKVFCGLGRGVSETGNMIEEAMGLAEKTLKRFSMLIIKMGIDDPRIIATSAVRDAKNGPDFVERIKDYTGLSIEVIRGKEEARLSANGVICAVPHASGVMADLGGGSLELATIENRQVKNECTLPIGPLRLQDQEGKWFDHPKRMVKKNLADIDWLSENKGKKFYAVGGAWRSLARIHMDMIDYPHVNMHNYIIPVNEIISLAKKVSKMSLVEVYQYRSVISEKRAKIISLASLTLYHLLKTLKPSKFVVSGFGVREGVLYDGMSDEVRKQDPLIVGCHQVAEMTGRFPEHGQRLYKWIDPLFTNESNEQKRLRLAICILSDVGWRGHPEYRADKVVGEVLYGRFGGINHWGVGLISMALYTCYGGSRQYSDQVEIAVALISKYDLDYARKIGMALRLARRLSAGTERGLKIAKLEAFEDNLILKIKKEKKYILNDVVLKRLDALARVFDLDANVSKL